MIQLLVIELLCNISWSELENELCYGHLLTGSLFDTLNTVPRHQIGKMERIFSGVFFYF
jgi:hypothetical protein